VLFNRTPMQRDSQMTPASSGLSEPARGGNLYGQ
jgi:hypothetical protein